MSAFPGDCPTSKDWFRIVQKMAIATAKAKAPTFILPGVLCGIKDLMYAYVELQC